MRPFLNKFRCSMTWPNTEGSVAFVFVDPLQFSHNYLLALPVSRVERFIRKCFDLGVMC